MNNINKRTNGNTKRLCRMVRSWNTESGALMSGYLIDTTVYRFLNSGYEYADKGFVYYDWMSRDYFDYLLEHADQSYWIVPGSGNFVWKKYSFKNEVEKAKDNVTDALSAYSNDWTYTWHQKWRYVYRSKFPSA